MPRGLILRGTPEDWIAKGWSGDSGERDRFAVEDCCYGSGHGHFTWEWPLDGVDLMQAKRHRVMCESSSRRIDTPQTDADHYPTTLQLLLNGVVIYHGILQNHPHDARGVLSYLRGGRGAYRYLVRATTEGENLARIVQSVRNDRLRLQCLVPNAALAQGGLSIYGAACGRYPLGPTVIIEW